MSLLIHKENIFLNKIIEKKAKQKIYKIISSYLSINSKNGLKKLIDDKVSGLNIAVTNGMMVAMLKTSKIDNIKNIKIIKKKFFFSL